MTELIIFGAVAIACLALGFFMYRSMKETGGCGCCSHLNEHDEKCNHEHHDHDHCDCEKKK